MIYGQFYYCPDCGRIIEEDELDYDTWQESRPYGEGCCYETMADAKCPHCGNKDIEDLDLTEDQVELWKSGLFDDDDIIDNPKPLLKELYGDDYDETD